MRSSRLSWRHLVGIVLAVGIAAYAGVSIVQYFGEEEKLERAVGGDALCSKAAEIVVEGGRKNVYRCYYTPDDYERYNCFALVRDEPYRVDPRDVVPDDVLDGKAMFQCLP